MRKILFILLILLIGALLFMTIVSGFPIQNVPIYALEEIKSSSEELSKKLDEITQITHVSYPQKNSELTRNIKELETEKQTYLEKAEYSSAEDIAKANMQESYNGNFLWIRLGNYATKEGIVAKLDFTTSSSGNSELFDIKFTLNGTYVSITDFIYSIENDQTLNFRIQDFALVPGGATEISKTEDSQESTTSTKGADTTMLQATFVVKDLAIVF